MNWQCIFRVSTLRSLLLVLLSFGLFSSSIVHAVEFTPHNQFSAGNMPNFMASGDINNDGKSDLIATNWGGSTVSVLINQTQSGSDVPDFAVQQEFPTNPSPTSVATADINGDGRLDLVAASYNGQIAVLMNTTQAGASDASFAPFFLLWGFSEVQTMAIADMNGDGKPDIVTNIESMNAASVWINTTSQGSLAPSFATQQMFETSYMTRAVAVADVNGDGKVDVIAGKCNQLIGVLLNQSEPGALTVALSPSQTFPTSTCAAQLATGDLNGDGKPDLVLGNATLNSISVVINTTNVNEMTASFRTPQVFSTGLTPIGVQVSDINGDGRLDLLASNYNGSSISVIINTTFEADGAVSFAERQDFTVGAGARAIVSADLNADGKNDVGAANLLSNTVSILINTSPLYDPVYASGFD